MTLRSNVSDGEQSQKKFFSQPSVRRSITSDRRLSRACTFVVDAHRLKRRPLLAPISRNRRHGTLGRARRGRASRGRHHGRRLPAPGVSAEPDAREPGARRASERAPRGAASRPGALACRFDPAPRGLSRSFATSRPRRPSPPPSVVPARSPDRSRSLASPDRSRSLASPSARPPSPPPHAGVRGLPRAQPRLVLDQARHLPVPQLQRPPPRPRRARLVRALGDDGHVVDRAVQHDEARREREDAQVLRQVRRREAHAGDPEVQQRRRRRLP